MTTPVPEPGVVGAVPTPLANGAGPRRGALPRALVILIGAAATVVVVAGIQATAWLIGPAFMALIVVIAVAPVHGWLRRHGWPGWATTLVLILLVYGILLALALGIIFSLARLGTELPQYASKADGLVNSATAKLAELGVGSEQIKQAASSLNLGKLAGVIGALLSSVAGLASNFVFLLALLLFLSVETGGAGDRVASIAAERPRIAEALGHFAWGTRQYLLVTTVFGFIVAVLDSIALAILGIPLAVTWGLLSFITNYIPNIGFILGVMPPALLGLLTGGPKLMVIVIVVYCVLNTRHTVGHPAPLHRRRGRVVGHGDLRGVVLLGVVARPARGDPGHPAHPAGQGPAGGHRSAGQVGRRPVAGLGQGTRPGRTPAGEEAPSPARPWCRPGRWHGRTDRRAAGPRGAGRAIGRTGAIRSSTGPARQPEGTKR